MLTIAAGYALREQEERMRFHHMCIVTADLDEAIRLWRDVMGFELKVKMTIPDGEAFSASVMAPKKLLEDLYKVPGASATVAVLISPQRAMIELLQPQVPKVASTPGDRLGYAHTGIHELGLVLEGIDEFFHKVRAAGYRTQTEYVWPCANMGRTFIFYDKEDNMIQIWEHSPEAPAELRVP
jgi:catechol 2,3-dioxygenase-like lactoylglutathione lyase family enzyme